MEIGLIIEYQKPETLEEALIFLGRKAPITLALAGGTVLTTPNDYRFAVVDLQKLSLNDFAFHGRNLRVGAMVTLQRFLGLEGYQPALAKAVEHEATRNLRNMGTLGGTLISSDGRSPLAAILMAADAQLHLLPKNEEVDLGDLLHTRNYEYGVAATPGRLITEVVFNTEVALSYEYVARSIADRAIVTVSAARWSSGRLRLVVGGWGRIPRLAFDAPSDEGWETAVHAAAEDSGDEWATAEYRQDVAVVLAERAVAGVSE